MKLWLCLLIFVFNSAVVCLGQTPSPAPISTCDQYSSKGSVIAFRVPGSDMMLCWDYQPDINAPAIAGFRVKSASFGGTYVTLTTVGPTVQALNIKAPPEVTWYSVFSYRANGIESPPSTPILVVPVKPPPVPPPSATSIFTNDRDVGAVGVPGSSSFSNGIYTVVGAGADVFGTLDSFHYVFKPVSGDFVLTARVASIQPINTWTKAGLMLRESANAGSSFFFSALSAGNGDLVQYRTATGAAAVSVDASRLAGAAPLWLRLRRVGQLIIAERSIDGTSWVTLASATLTAMPSNAVVGLAVTSHDTTKTATATFDNVR